MPHIIVEYSPNQGLNVPALLQELHTTLGGQETVDLRRIKTRAIPVPDAVVGDIGPAGGMVHVTLKLLPRPDALAKKMATALQDVVRRHVKPDCAVTVETVALNPETYCT